jgi:hypothetical protein
LKSESFVVATIGEVKWLANQASNRVLEKNILARDGIIVPLSAPVYGPITLP